MLARPGCARALERLSGVIAGCLVKMEPDSTPRVRKYRNRADCGSARRPPRKLGYFALTTGCAGEPGVEIVLEPDKRKAKRDRLEVFAIRDAVCAKPRLENAAHRGNERAAAGQKHAVDVVDPHSFGFEESVDSQFDAADVVGYPAFEIRTRDLLLYFDITEPEHKIGARRS